MQQCESSDWKWPQRSDQICYKKADATYKANSSARTMWNNFQYVPCHPADLGQAVLFKNTQDIEAV